MTNSDSPRPGGATQPITVHDDSKSSLRRVGSRRQTEKAPKPQKEKWVPPGGTILPDRGWPRFLYAIYRLLSIEKVPAISAAQQAELKRNADEEQRRRVQADLDEYEQQLIVAAQRSNQRRRWCVVVSDVKGGSSKSPTAAIIANFIGWATKRLTTAVDNNPYEGTLSKWVGIDRDDTVSIRQMNDRIHEGRIGEFVDFSVPLGSNPYNVQLVVSDSVVQKQSYDQDTAKSVISTAKQNSIFVVNDTGNGIGEGAVEAALEESDVLVVPALNKDDKLEGVRNTLDSFTEWGHTDIARHAIVLINGLHPGQSAEDYREMLMLDSDTILIGIPFDPWLDVYQPVIPEKLQQQTRIACLELVLIVSLVARYTQNQGRGVRPKRFPQGRLVKLSSGRVPELGYVKHTNDNVDFNIGDVQ